MRLMEIQQLYQEFAQVPTIKGEYVYNLNEVVRRKQFHSGHEVHVWQATTLAEFSPSLFNLLSDEERLKALNYKLVRDQSRYVSSHGILRQILAAYSGQAPSELRYVYTKYGKPILNNQKTEKQLYFNMTHAEDAVCYIVSIKNEAGIDLEKVNGDFDWYSIAQAYFSHQERCFLESIASDEQANAFFYIWTRKEALLKALGVGLSGMGSMGDDVLSYFNDKYVMASFQLEENFQGSLAVDSRTSGVRFMRWRG
jgi:4'-phosphopantetheinyl transferase